MVVKKLIMTRLGKKYENKGETDGYVLEDSTIVLHHYRFRLSFIDINLMRTNSIKTLLLNLNDIVELN